MNTRILTLAIALSSLGLHTALAQQAKNPISTTNRNQVQRDFLHKKQAFPKGNFFNIFNSPSLSQEERDALTFLYAYMPSNDLIDRDGAYFL